MANPTGQLSDSGVPAGGHGAVIAVPPTARLELVRDGETPHVVPHTPDQLADDEIPLRGGSRTGAPTHRRRARWFELNPGCFGRAALWGGGAALGGAALGGLGLWAAWRLRRAVGIVRTARAMWRGYRRVHQVLIPRAERARRVPASPRRH